MLTYGGNVLKVGGWLNAVPTPYPVTLPANTLRCKFVEGTAPISTSGTWTKVVGVTDNLWDFYRSNASWYDIREPNILEIVASGDLSSVQYTQNLFLGCPRLSSVCDLDLHSVIRMDGMFYDCTSLVHAPNIITGNGLRYVNQMFRGCTALVDVPLYNTSGVIGMNDMFYGCTSLESVPLYNTESATSMTSMFMGCTSITRVPNFNTRNVVYAQYMFDGCHSLVEAPNIDTSSVSDMHDMFTYCTSLTAVPLYDTRNASNVRNMFYWCENVESGALALYQQMSTQQYVPNSYTECFAYCGSNTVTGAAELAQIPSSWGGTGA